YSCTMKFRMSRMPSQSNWASSTATSADNRRVISPTIVMQCRIASRVFGEFRNSAFVVFDACSIARRPYSRRSSRYPRSRSRNIEHHHRIENRSPSESIRTPLHRHALDEIDLAPEDFSELILTMGEVE